jgi:phosphoenolpyruvate carboxykinase (GTP)
VRPSRQQNSFWCASAAEDMARVEDRTFTFSQEQSSAGPTNDRVDPLNMRAVMTEQYRGVMATGADFR